MMYKKKDKKKRGSFEDWEFVYGVVLTTKLGIASLNLYDEKGVIVMVFNATFNNISFISWGSV